MSDKDAGLNAFRLFLSFCMVELLRKFPLQFCGYICFLSFGATVRAVACLRVPQVLTLEIRSATR